MRYIIGDKWLRVKGYWFMVIGLMLIAGCSSDSTGTEEQRTGSLLQVTAYTANYQEKSPSMRTVSAGYSEYRPDHDLAIGLLVLPLDHTSGLPTEFPSAKLVRFSAGDWHSQVTVDGDTDYKIFGYMPKNNSISSEMSQSGNDYQLILSGIDAVIADDVCFVTGVKDGTKEGAGDLLQGKFDYKGKSEDNHVCLLMDHLYAALRIQFKVDPDYSALRTIKLKSMTLKTEKATVNAIITLTPNNAGADPVKSITFEPTGSTASATFFESSTGVQLNNFVDDETGTAEEKAAAAREEILSAFCCFAPGVLGLSDALTLECTYDLYDRHGNKVCERTTPNALHLSAARGQFVTLNLTIAPTYLGQLSDQDLDNPTFTVN